MLYTIIRKSGRIIDFDTEKYCVNEPFKAEAKGSIHIESEFNLCLDLLEEEGLILQTFWYDAKVDDETDKTYDPVVESDVYHANRRLGRYICLVDKEEIDDVVQIFRDNKLIAWRVGDWLVDGVKFAAQELLCFSDATTTSLNKKALKIYEYLMNTTPGADAEQIAKSVGFPEPALDIIKDNEAANTESDESFEDGDFGEFEEM